MKKIIILMMGIWTDCRGCIIIIISYFWLCFKRVAWIHFYQLFWSSSSRTYVLCWKSSNLFTLSSLGMINFICTFTLIMLFLSTSISCHSGNTFLCKGTIQCRSTTSRQILISHYNATTLSLRHSWRKGWQRKIEVEETDSTKQLGRIKHSTLSKFWWPIV